MKPSYSKKPSCKKIATNTLQLAPATDPPLTPTPQEENSQSTKGRLRLASLTFPSSDAAENNNASPRQEEEEEDDDDDDISEISEPPGAYAVSSGEAVRRHKPYLPDQPSAQSYAPAAVPEDEGEPLHENPRTAFPPEEASGGKKSVTEKSPPRRKKILIILGLLLLVVAIGAGVGGALAGGGADSPLPVPTDAPSDANPESAELVELRKELAGTVSSEIHLLNSSSPQYHALKWILEEDDLSRVDNFEKLKARYILAVFYYSLGGQAWDDSVNPWLNRTADECSWEMVSCTGEGRIKTLTQRERVGMKGTIPSELQHLPGLSTVEIINNVISGLAGALPNLRKFSLQGLPRGSDSLLGGIPGAIFEMTDLEHLSMNFFNLEGTISTAIGNLKELTTLDLSNNRLSGTLTSELHALKNLNALDLENNGDLGGVFMEVVSGLSELTNLRCGGNRFSGSVGSELLSMLGLKRLSLVINDMSGPFPNFLSELTGLEDLDVRKNRFTGTISTEIGDLSNLEFFMLSGNSLTGTIPTELGSFHVVRKFDLENNRFEGGIPSELGNLMNMGELHLESNDLTGSVPKEICGLGTLSTLVVPRSVECCSSEICTHA